MHPSNLATDEHRQEKLRKELDPERNELFFATRLLLVEGDTEKLALPEFARRLGIDLDGEGATIVEVGGKRNLPEFAAIASSFGIPTGVLFDEDSSEFKDRRADETVFNNDLLALSRDNGSVRVWMFSKRYEDYARRAVGDELYAKLCEKYPNHSKAVRARLLAADSDMPVFEPLPEVLEWLRGTRSASKQSIPGPA